MSVKITKELVKDWEKTLSNASCSENQITDRIDYIIRTWFKTFDGELDYWYFDGAEENEVGDLYLHMTDTSIDGIYTQVKKQIKNNDKHDMVIIDKFGHEYGWESAIPTRWLFEDFESELIDGKKKFDAKVAENKIKQKEVLAKKKLEQQELIESAKKKLSKKELAAIRKS